MSRRGVPIIYYLLTAFTGVAASICFSGWFRQLVLFFGMHTVSTITIIVSSFLCLSLGGFLAGRLSDRPIHRLAIFSLFSVLIGLYMLLHPVIFQWITGLFFRINRVQQPGPYGVEIVRFILSFLALLLPAGLLAGTTPLLIRHFIKHTSYSGRFMSGAITAGSAGIITGLLFSSWVMIPHYGLNTTLTLGALIHLFTAVLATGYIFLSRLKSTSDFVPVNTARTKRTVLRFKKKKPVLETTVKLTRAMMRVYAFQGFTLAAMLLLCLRVLKIYSTLNPYYFFSTFIMIMLTGIALGSALYKRISEKPPNKYLTLATLQIINGFSAASSYALMNILAATFLDPSHLTKTFTGILLRHGLLFASLLLIPAILTGLSLPLAGRSYPKRLQQIGSNFGYLESVLFMNAIAGVVIVQFLLIPLLGLHYTYIFLVLMTVLSGIYLIFRDSRLIRGFRIGYAFTALLLFLLLISVFKIFGINMQGSPADRKIVGNAALISTSENSDGSRAVFINGKYYFGSDRGNLKVQQLAALIPKLINPGIQSALVVGFGTGTTASGLEEYGVQTIHITDIYPEVIRLSSDVFGDDNNDIMTNSHVDITIEDAKSYLIRSEKQFDLITSGIDQLNQMPGIYTKDFYQICFDKLNDQGLICQVIPVNKLSEIECRTLLKSCSVVFRHVTLWYGSAESILLIASKEQNSLDWCSLLSVYSKLNAGQTLTAINLPNVESVFAHAIMDDEQLRIFAGDAPINSDNNPIIDYSQEILTKEWKLLPLLTKIPVDYSRFMDVRSCSIDKNEVFKKIKRLNQSLLQQGGPSSGLIK